MGKKAWIPLGILLLCLGCSLGFGATGLSLGQIFQAAAAGPKNTAGVIFWYVRLPRTLGCALAGAGLAVSGGVIQRVLRNSLASPGIIGVNAGAGLAVTVCCALGILGSYASAAAAFLGAVLAVLLILFAGEKTGASRSTVILGGVAVNAILNACADAITTLVPEAGMLAGEFRVGGFSSVTMGKLGPAALGIAVALAALLLFARELELLELGEEMAGALGMNVRRFRILFLIMAAVLAGCAVTLGGLLGFVGLMVPHFVRRFYREDGGGLILLWACFGGAFVTGCDTLARVLFAPYELPVGILLSLMGGPAFLGILWKQKGGRRRGGNS